MRSAVVAAMLGLIVLATPALAAPPEEAATDLSTEIMSPFCPGVTLHECPSAEALRLRDRIESWFRAGMSETAILDRLEAEYGKGIRATPSGEGFGLAAWLVTAAGVALALGTGFVLMRRWSRKDNDAAPRASIDPGERGRLDEELARLRTQS